MDKLTNVKAKLVARCIMRTLTVLQENHEPAAAQVMALAVLFREAARMMGVCLVDLLQVAENISRTESGPRPEFRACVDFLRNETLASLKGN